MPSPTVHHLFPPTISIFLILFLWAQLLLYTSPLSDAQNGYYPFDPQNHRSSIYASFDMLFALLVMAQCLGSFWFAVAWWDLFRQDEDFHPWVAAVGRRVRRRERRVRLLRTVRM